MHTLSHNFKAYKEDKKLKNARIFLAIHCFMKIKRFLKRHGGLDLKYICYIKHKLSLWGFIK